MKSLSASIVTAALLVAGVSAQNFQINTPNSPTQCVPTQFTWTGGSQPYFLMIDLRSIAPAGVPGAAAFQQYQGLTGTSFTWSTNLTAGTSFGLTLTDSTGATAQSAPVTVLSGPDNSCLNGQTSTPSGGSTTSAGTGPSTTSPATGATTSTPAGGSTTKPAGSSTGTTTGTSSSSGSTVTGGAGNNGAFSNTVSVALVGVIGAAAAALLA